MSAYPGHSIRVGASIQEQLNHLQMTLKSGDHERSVSTLWNTEKVEGTMRYYHRPLAHTTFIIHFSLTLKWTLNCTNIWTLKWTRLRHFLLSMRDTQSESDHNILPQTRTRKIILSIEHHIIVSSQKTNIRVPYNTNIHLWYFLIDVEMKTKLLIICPAVRFIRRSIHEYLDHGIRVGASIQEQLNHLQMTLHSRDDERSCYSGPILWETGWETRWETRRHQNKLNYAETIRIG